MIALSLFRNNELSSSNTGISVIDEFHVTTESTTEFGATSSGPISAR